MKNLLLTTCVILALAIPMPALAQGQQPPPTSKPTQVPPSSTTPPVLAPPPPGQQRPATPPPAGVPIAPSQPGANVWTNIKLDITIVDSPGSGPAVRKVLTLHIADGRQGQVRSQSEQGLINVDAQVQTRSDGKTILLGLSVEYRQGASGSQFSESLQTMIVDGKPMVLSQTADASGDRKVSVEVTATIQKVS